MGHGHHIEIKQETFVVPARAKQFSMIFMVVGLILAGIGIAKIDKSAAGHDEHAKVEVKAEGHDSHEAAKGHEEHTAAAAEERLSLRINAHLANLVPCLAPWLRLRDAMVPTPQTGLERSFSIACVSAYLSAFLSASYKPLGVLLWFRPRLLH